MKCHLSHRNQFFENGQKSQGQTSRLVELNLGQAETKTSWWFLALLTLAVVSYKHSLQVQTVAMLARGSAKRRDTINQHLLRLCKLALKAIRLSPEIHTKQKKIQYNWYQSKERYHIKLYDCYRIFLWYLSLLSMALQVLCHYGGSEMAVWQCPTLISSPAQEEIRGLWPGRLFHFTETDHGPGSQ